jgi:hypothetical protein
VVLVVEPEPLPVLGGGGDRGEDTGVHGRAGPGDGGHGAVQGVDPVPEPGGQHLLELEQGPQRGLLDPGDGAAGGRAQAHRDRDRLLVVEQQRGQGGTRAQPVAAAHPRAGLDGIAQVAQALDVVADRPAGDPEPLGQLVPGPVGPRLQQAQQLQQPLRGVHAGASLPAITERLLPQ